MVSLRGRLRFLVRTGLFLAFISMGTEALAAGVPACSASPTLQPFRSMAVNNQQVLVWKLTTRNQFLARGFVEGRVVRDLPDQTGHRHFLIQIGQRPTEVLEVIYSEDFGAMPMPRIGAVVYACGDYITSTATSGSLPPSPAGAIIHWVHQSDSPNHASGFVMVDNVVYGNLGGQRGGRPLD